MLRMRTAVWALTVAALGLQACSDTGDGGNGGKAGGNTTQSCQGSFCVDQDQKPSALPDKLAFTDLPVGQTQTLELRIVNIGNRGILKVNGVTIQPASDEFSVVDFQPASLEPQHSVTMHVLYAPKVTGAKSLNLLVDNNAVTVALQKLAVPITVVAGGSSLLIQPSPIDFGNVDGKTGADKTVKLFNIGTQPLQLASVKLTPSGSPDFTIPTAPDMKAPILAGEGRDVVLHYLPTGGDHDNSSLLVELIDGRKDSALVQGAEIAPDLVAIPPKRDFGSVNSGADASTTIKLKNQGAAKLHIEKIEAFGPALKTSTFELSAAGPLDLEGQQDIVLTVTLHCKEALPSNGSAFASLKVTSNDPGTPVLSVPLFAHTDAGLLQVTPADELNFLFVGKGLKVKKNVDLFNAGTAPIDVTKVDIAGDALGEFTLVPGTFKATSATPATSTLDAGKPDSFDVQFEAKGPAGGTATAKLHIHSSDPTHPDYPLTLTAMRQDVGECNVKLLPQPLNYGLVPYGATKVLKLNVQNIGSGYCSFDSSKVTDCKGNSLPPPLGPGPSVCTSGGSTRYKTFAPSTKLFNLAPGDTGSIQVQFDAPNQVDGILGLPGGKPNDLTEIDALIVMVFKDAGTGALKNFPAIDLTKPAQLAAAKPNLVAQIGLADVQVLPDHIDFGIVTVGCKSPVAQATVYNTGKINASVTKAELQNCGAEVDPVNWPGIPKTGTQLTSSKPLTLSVQYAPQNVGKDQCALVVYTDLSGVCSDKTTGVDTGTSCSSDNPCTVATQWCKGTQFTVPMVGEGTLDTEFTDLFDQGTGKKVDILFVVDNSGSMSNKQAELAKNFQEFVKIAVLWNNDYHVGVVTTDVEDPNQSGRLQDASGVRIVSKKDADPTGKLLKLANQGANGSGDEQGLQGAYLALKLPLTADTLKTCVKDADCGGAPAECVTNPDDGSKACGGHNRAFIRKNAALEIVVLSDEEDSSPNPPDFYANYFYSIHGIGNKNLFHFHAIAGDPGSGCKGNGDATPGDRYNDLVQKTGGKFGSICANDYAQFLKDIGNAAFGLTEQYFLTRNPEPSTIDVKINGVACKQAGDTWAYDGASNSVTFAPAAKGGKCMPQTGDKIAIHYKMLCFP
jgi:hypothetical protein